MRSIFVVLLLVVLAACTGCQPEPVSEPVSTAIQPLASNPFYWSYNSEPILLLGGSKEDNLFQIDDLEAHLNLLEEAGGNYVRNTMSSRDSGNVWAYARDPVTGLYDLNTPNEAYWSRFERFLQATGDRDIIVQIEVWATFDFYDDRDMRRGFWQNNPFNPKNNTNYTAEESGLPEVVDSHPTQTNNPFFFTVPEELDNTLLLTYQEAFVKRLLSHSLKYDHVLYCMDNETSVTPWWGAYWSTFIKAVAAQNGRLVQTTEMWDPWDLAHEMHSNTFDHPETYSFVDISQNNHNTGQEHWDNAQVQRRRILESGTIRPMNNVKVYGAGPSRFGTERDGIERFWRNVFGGMASTRFHRPESGLGLSETARVHLRSARMVTDAFDVFTAEPTLDVLSDREGNEAFAMSAEGRYAVFFPDGGSVSLAPATPGTYSVTWLDIEQSQWSERTRADSGESGLLLTTPGPGYYAVLVEAL